MNPALFQAASLDIVEGPSQGTLHALVDAETSIGREPGNHLVLLDGGVSRKHCVIRRAEAGFMLVDLGSRNATLVNGRPASEWALNDGDQIQIGKSKIVFRRPSGYSQTAVTGSIGPGKNSIILRADQARYAGQEKLPADERTVRDLNAILRISKAVQSERTRAGLHQQILRSVLEASGADSAAIALGESPADLEMVIQLDRVKGFVPPGNLSRTVIRVVTEQRVAVLTNDVESEEGLQGAESLIMRRVKAVVAAPMEAFQRLLGVLYLESGKDDAFDQNLLELMTAVAGIAALALENANRMDSLAEENQRLLEEMDVNHDMIGQSPAMKQVVESVGRAARADATVLITGESGTGKELVARAVHRNSNRCDRPFVAINCAAIPENLLESELFGHERGAFTGAVAQKKGKLELAAGGTVFLDEIGEMAPLLQGKLLRVLQEREMERVGGTKPIQLDIRLIAATNRDLREESRANRFRSDLYYRLNVVSVRMPPLRERREDIPLLAAHFADRFSALVKRRIRGISKAAMSVLVRYDWPGNVRELENAIERAVVMGACDQILPEDLPDTLLEQPSVDEGAGGLYEALREAKRQIIDKALAEAHGSQVQAAAVLGVHPNHLSRLIRTLEMKRGRVRG